MKLSLQSLQPLAAKGYLTPAFDIPAMRETTRQNAALDSFRRRGIFSARFRRCSYRNCSTKAGWTRASAWPSVTTRKLSTRGFSRLTT